VTKFGIARIRRTKCGDVATDIVFVFSVLSEGKRFQLWDSNVRDKKCPDS